MKNKLVTLRLTDEDRTRLERLAAEEHTSLSEIIRALTRRGIEVYTAEQAAALEF